MTAPADLSSGRGRLVREARFWAPACHSFPLWIGILLKFDGCICGVCVTAAILSSAVRRVLISLLLLLVAWLYLAQGAPDTFIGGSVNTTFLNEQTAILWSAWFFSLLAADPSTNSVVLDPLLEKALRATALV